MSNKVQCPYCGGYKVNAKKREAIKGTKEIPVSFGKALFYAIGVLITWAILSLFFSSVLTAFVNDISWIPWVLFGLLGLGIILYAIPHASSKTRRVSTRYHYYCQLCGYQWVWETGMSLPKVTVCPDLIAQGEKRLEEENRTLKEDVYELYYLTQQLKK